ncbi:hypothetical protein LSTR_LSTR009741 [Laodelphax striatellus]|uniref:Uncharacterized protein n=1 Tax=Laodelphax striatellus TaxID=195883 RepID=A0A482WT80_LAOST|nr:hypothetical protein LSTR_LSTR009741 [Laodelphax striatellus]
MGLVNDHIFQTTSNAPLLSSFSPVYLLRRTETSLTKPMRSIERANRNSDSARSNFDQNSGGRQQWIAGSGTLPEEERDHILQIAAF